MGLFKKLKSSKNSENDAVSIEEKVERSLIILIDKKLPNLQESLVDRGLNVSTVYNDIEDIKIGLLMQSGNCRVVVIESGLGVFTTVTMREEIKDLLGMCNGDDKKLTVFYTDSVIKSDSIKTPVGKQIDWNLYTTMADVISKLKEYNETYIMTEDVYSEKLISVEEALKITGDYVEENQTLVNTDGHIPEDPEELRKLAVKNTLDFEDILPNFEVSY